MQKVLKRELGAFMKGLDFGKAVPVDVAEEEYESGEEEEGEEASEQEEAEQEDETEVEEDEDEDARDDAEVSAELFDSPNPPQAQLPPALSSGLVDRDPKSGSVCLYLLQTPAY